MDTSKGQTDESKGPADGLSGWTDTLTVSDSAGSARISHSNDPDMYLGPGDVKHVIHEADGVGSQTDASTGHSDMPSIETDLDIPANETGIISTRRKDSTMQNSPYMCKIATCRPTSRWRRVSIEDIDIYIPWNVPVEAPG